MASDDQKTARVQLLMTPDEVKAIDDWSFENRVRGRSEAIRRLIELGLGKGAKKRDADKLG
jgi:metal-responsive CopG/Arc/MetJ family transcriptional regulator